MLGLSNEVYNLSVAQVVQEKLSKVRQTFVYRRIFSGPSVADFTQPAKVEFLIITRTWAWSGSDADLTNC